MEGPTTWLRGYDGKMWLEWSMRGVRPLKVLCDDGLRHRSWQRHRVQHRQVSTIVGPFETARSVRAKS